MRDASLEVPAERTPGDPPDDAIEAVVGISRAGRVIRVGPGADGLFHRPDGPLAGSRLGDLGVGRTAAARCLRAVRGVFRSGAVDAFDLTGAFVPDHEYVVELVPEFDANVTVSSVLMIVRDVTLPMRRRERDARAARERFARDRLVAAVLHALRSSLNGIHLWSHVLEQQMHDASPGTTTRRACDGIRAGIEQQTVLIDNLHEVAAPVARGDRPSTTERSPTCTRKVTARQLFAARLSRAGATPSARHRVGWDPRSETRGRCRTARR